MLRVWKRWRNLLSAAEQFGVKTRFLVIICEAGNVESMIDIASGGLGDPHTYERASKDGHEAASRLASINCPLSGALCFREGDNDNIRIERAVLRGLCR